MAECKHELKDLVGMADGIHCTACGKIFKDYDDLYQAKLEYVQKNTAPKAAPRKGGKANARK